MLVLPEPRALTTNADWGVCISFSAIGETQINGRLSLSTLEGRNGLGIGVLGILYHPMLKWFPGIMNVNLLRVIKFSHSRIETIAFRKLLWMCLYYLVADGPP